MTMTLEELKTRIAESNLPDGGISLITDYLTAHPDDDEALTMRGMRHWSRGERSAAINDYLAAVKLNPNSRAKNALRAAYDILNYYNKDLYNP